MNQFRKLLSPFSVLYDGVTKIRNTLYDNGWFKSNTYEIPLIIVGNLSVGGTGKTPMVAYLVKLLKTQFKIAVLSRGYKRKTSGFVLADATATAETLGDEPFQLVRKHSDILVAVDADRNHGIQELLHLPHIPDLILLDDAFQHRQVKADFNILLTAYDDLYIDDAVLPAGNLRERVSGAERAQVIIVTKCPENLSEIQEFEIAKRLKPTLTQTVFFTKIQYADFVQNEANQIKLSEMVDYKVILITGIANPKTFLDFLNSKNIKFEHLEFPDHHSYTEKELIAIKKKFNDLGAIKKLILTTEKDYVRIFAGFADLYYLAIETSFINHQKDFDKLILNYVGQSSRNS